MKQMDGDIDVQSTVGIGSVFSVLLPVKVIAPDEKPALQDQTHTTENEADKGLSVLVVDDNEINRRVLGGAIEKMGHHPSYAVNGQEAIWTANNTVYDLIILDIHMPVMDGREAFQVIRAKGANTRTQIIAATADMMTETVQELMELGFDKVIGKPLETDILKSVLDKCKASTLDN